MKHAVKSLSIIVMVCLFFTQGNTQQKSTESLNSLLPEVFKSYSSQRKRDIQTKLKEIGFYKSPVDGTFDRDTQRAIQDFISRFHYDLISSGVMFQGGMSRIDGFRRLNKIFEDLLTSEKKDLEVKVEIAQQKAAEKEAQEAEAKRLAKLEAEKEAQEAEAKRL
ncbi:MAG: peptidoglycan-binding protein, partial [Paracoccaceae bacterium]